jgi:hypothetical protein
VLARFLVAVVRFLVLLPARFVLLLARFDVLPARFAAGFFRVLDLDPDAFAAISCSSLKVRCAGNS